MTRVLIAVGIGWFAGDHVTRALGLQLEGKLGRVATGAAAYIAMRALGVP